MENWKNGTKITDKHTNRYIVTKYQDVILNKIGDNPILDEFVLDDFIHHEFIILSEEDEEIDIDSIEELDYCLEELEKPSYEESWLMNCIRANKDKLNELIKAVKQLNNKIKE